jgi:hypothetical protein
MNQINQTNQINQMNQLVLLLYATGIIGLTVAGLPNILIFIHPNSLEALDVPI